MGSQAVITPDLEQQLEWAQQHGTTVEAVFRLRDSMISTGAAVTQTTKSVLSRATETTRLRPADWNVFENLGYFVLVALPSYIRAVARQPEIAKAQPNRRR
jgi:hypothetical protein